MAKKAVDTRTKVAWKGFVNCEMNAQRKEQFSKWRQENPDLGSAILECLSPGYKLSFSVDTYHDALQVSWFCGAAGDPNAGWCLTARAVDIDKAFRVLMFKHLVVLEGDWTSVAPLDEGVDGIG